VRARASIERSVRRTTARERERLLRALRGLERGARTTVERRRASLGRAEGRLSALSPRATLERGYAIVRAGDAVVRDASALAEGARVEVELARGAFGARVEDVRE
jgi:exodeoxyribonuclease VII large subunit